MRLGTLLHFYRVRLRARVVTELLAVIGISVGVALVFAALVASTSLTGSVRELTDGLVGASTSGCSGGFSGSREWRGRRRSPKLASA
jgi:hypothetical protein